MMKFEEKMRKVELLQTRDCEAGYGPDAYSKEKEENEQEKGERQGRPLPNKMVQFYSISPYLWDKKLEIHIPCPDA